MSLVLELVAGLLIAGIGVAFVLEPVLRGIGGSEETPASPSGPEMDDELTEPESPRALALVALREIEFDREMGKLDDADYRQLKAQYTAAALEAIRTERAEAGEGAVEAGEGGRAVGAVEAVVGGSDQLDALAEARIAKAGAQARGSAVLTAGVSPAGVSSVAASVFVCPTCGPRPEPDATFCSRCGKRLAA